MSRPEHHPDPQLAVPGRAFQGQTPRDAYFVRCDAQTTTPVDVEQGLVNCYVGFAPLKPAEFVIELQLIAGKVR